MSVSPTARAVSAAAAVLSTPPETAITAGPSSSLRSRATCASMTAFATNILAPEGLRFLEHLLLQADLVLLELGGEGGVREREHLHREEPRVLPAVEARSEE